jgi:hypothetical protein
MVSPHGVDCNADHGLMCSVNRCGRSPRVKFAEYVFSCRERAGAKKSRGIVLLSDGLTANPTAGQRKFTVGTPAQADSWTALPLYWPQLGQTW